MTNSQRQQLRTEKEVTAPKPADVSGATPDDLPEALQIKVVGIDEIDRLYKELRNAITGDPGELHAVKCLFEAIIFKNNARKRFG